MLKNIIHGQRNFAWIGVKMSFGGIYNSATTDDVMDLRHVALHGVFCHHLQNE